MPMDTRSVSNLRARLWRGGGLVAIFLATMCVGNFVIPSDRAFTKNMLGSDFLAFYYGGTCVRTGLSYALYDINATRRFELVTAHNAGLDIGPAFGPWWNPPFAAWIFAPLSA